MATQPQAKKTKGGNVKKELAAGQVPAGKNSIEANTIPQLEAWREKYPPRVLVWERG